MSGGTLQATGTRPVPGPQGLVLLGAIVAGARLGLRPISDNSTLVHLRTGIRIVHTWHVPTRDPYSFTAPGHPWVVQSWLVSLLYGAANAAGHHALILLQGAVMGAVAAVTALLARGVTAWRSALAATIAIAASAPGWSPRPLMFGLLCVALLILVVEREAHPLWIVPIVWVWVNSHGSWPLGLAWLAARACGEAIDRRGFPRQAAPRAAAFVGGLAVGMASPLTWHAVTFPFVAVQKRPTFQTIVEWRSPDFQNTNTLAALLFIAAALLILMRARTSWAHVLPVGGFLVLGLVAQRNLAALGIVLAPALAAALAGPVRPLGWAVGLGRAAPFRLAATLGVLLVLAGFVAWSTQRPVLDLSSYPVAATDYLASSGRLGAAHRIAAVDVVGCFLVWRAGPATKVFIDDRYDMYPREVVVDAQALAGGTGDAEGILDRYRIDTVLWARAGVLPAALLQAGGWRAAHTDRAWIVLERTTPAR